MSELDIDIDLTQDYEIEIEVKKDEDNDIVILIKATEEIYISKFDLSLILSDKQAKEILKKLGKIRIN